ncbi:hypothetical protein AC1031_007073 [Aphanomyces cochlioides]|nr:hypothetical protein AC1031_007073 [Aphanomyces cochlioides]
MHKDLFNQLQQFVFVRVIIIRPRSYISKTILGTSMAITQTKLLELVPMARTPRQRTFLLTLMAAHVVERPLIPAIRFKFTTNANAILDFRFDIDGIKQLGYLLGLPAVIFTENRLRAHQDEAAMCIVLGRLAFPVRFHAMSSTFGRSRSALCELFVHVINELYDRWAPLLLYFNEKLVRRRLDQYVMLSPQKELLCQMFLALLMVPKFKLVESLLMEVA